jgi:hypothetical protein
MDGLGQARSTRRALTICLTACSLGSVLMRPLSRESGAGQVDLGSNKFLAAQVRIRRMSLREWLARQAKR